MPHGYTIINSNGIEFSCKTSQLFNFFFDDLPGFMQMYVTRNKLGK